MYRAPEVPVCSLIKHEEYKCSRCARWKRRGSAERSEYYGDCQRLDLGTDPEFFCAHFQQKGPFSWFQDREKQETVLVFDPNQEDADSVCRFADTQILVSWLNRLWTERGGECHTGTKQS